MSSDMNGFPNKGGLGFLEISRDESYTNRLLPVNIIKASGSEPDIDLVLSPKGIGALSLQVPDGTIVGGNKRGQGSIDFQTLRTLVTGVTSGIYSFAAGQSNVISGNNSAGFGVGNNIAGAAAFSAGQGNTAGAQNAISLGNGNSVSGICSAAIGRALTASGLNVFLTGWGASSFGCDGRRSHSGNFLSTSGDSQHSRFSLRQSTTNATPTRLSVDAAAASAANQVTLQNNNVFYFKGEIVAKQTASTNVAVWTVSGTIVRGTSAATTVLVGTPTITAVTNIPVWGTPTLTADTVNGSLKITVTGLAATSIHWFANIETSEVIYA